VGEQWGGLNIGHLYQVLDRRARDGLIESERQPQAVKPDRLVHRITPAGRAELDRWLNEPNVRTRGYRDDFFLKVVAAAQAGNPETLAAVLRRQRVHLLTELRSLAEARAAAAASPVVALLVKAAELHVRADLGVVDAAEHDLSPAALAALRLPAAPRRGPRYPVQLGMMPLRARAGRPTARPRGGRSGPGRARCARTR
jgi:DNA-binding PadR family transcriptional regulator